MRLGGQKCRLVPGTLAHSVYGKDVIVERHRHRYEFNNAIPQALEEHGLIMSGLSMDGKLVEMVEASDHPWFLGLPVPPGVHLDTARRTPVVLRLHTGGACLPSAGRDGTIRPAPWRKRVPEFLPVSRPPTAIVAGAVES